MSKFAPILIAAGFLLAFAPVAADAAPVDVVYEEKSTEPGIWRDMQEQAVDPTVYEAQVGPIFMTMFSDSMWCSVNACPLRIYDGAGEVFSGEVCSNTSSHAIDVARRVFVACGERFELGEGGVD